MSKKIEFKVNYQKCVEVILYLINETQSPDIYHILKRIFAADKYHLNRHARPVTGDSYFAMKNGTVPSIVYDFLKNDVMMLTYIADKTYPFERINNTHNFKTSRHYNANLLSESDIEALQYGISEYSDAMDFNAIEEKNHKEHCWHKAWNQYRDDMGKTAPIYFEDMIEDKEIIEDLQENSSFLVI